MAEKEIRREGVVDSGSLWEKIVVVVVRSEIAGAAGR